MFLGECHPSRAVEPREIPGLLPGPFQLLWLEGPVSRLGP